jgi:class 3 adenylate cyclase
MNDVPDTHYLRTPNGHYAYQVTGEGDRAILFLSGTVTHIELRWEIPHLVRMYRRLMTFGRVLTFDPLGIGASDPLPDPPPTLEELSENAVAVMDAAGIDTFSVAASLHGVAPALAIAALNPERVDKLVCLGGYARLLVAPDFPEGIDPAALDIFFDTYLPVWGTGVASASIYGIEPDEKELPKYARLERASAAPGSIERVLRWITGSDARDIVPKVHQPVLLFGIPSRLAPIEVTLALVEQLHDVHFLDYGHDPISSGEGLDEMMAEISEFLTGSRAASHADRSLAAVLFVDLVGSTELAAELGDTRWRDTLGAFRIAVRHELDRYGGDEVNTRGDDFLARFDRVSSAIECASELRTAVGAMDLHLRAGVHVGEVDLDGDDLSGVAVHVGARVASLANPDEILVTTAAREAVAGMTWSFEDRGTHPLKGVPGEWRLFAVDS